VKELIKNKQWEELLKEDQLIKERNEHKVQRDDSLCYKHKVQLEDLIYYKHKVQWEDLLCYEVQWEDLLCCKHNVQWEYLLCYKYKVQETESVSVGLVGIVGPVFLRANISLCL